MKKRIAMTTALLLALCLLLAACSGGAASTPASATGGSQTQGASAPGEQPGGELSKIAFITGVGGLGDKSFNDRGYEGVQRLMDANAVDVTVVEPTEIAEMETILRNLSEAGDYMLIIGMGGDMVDPMSTVAVLYPDQDYMVLDGYAGTENVRSVFVQTADAGLINGCLAGLLEKNNALPGGEGKNIIGVIGGMDIPATRSSVVAFVTGARYINPDVEVLVSYVGSFTDPATASEQAQAMYDQGASIVFAAAGGSGLGVFEAAQASEKYALGASSNQNSLAPDNIVASAARAMDVYIENTVYDLLDGKFEPGDFPIGLAEDPNAIILLYEESNVSVPQEIKAEMEDIKAQMAELKKTNDLPTDLDQVDGFLEKIGEYTPA